MKKISYWGKNNKPYARFLIIISFLFLTALGILTGTLLSESGVQISTYTLLILISIYIISITLYPYLEKKRSGKKPAREYTRHKTFDFILASTGFCMIICMSNQPNYLFQNSASLFATELINETTPGDSSLKTYKSISAFAGSMKDASGKSLSWKAKKKLLKIQVKEIQKSKDMSGAAKAGLIILSVIIALGLLALVAALSCELSCSGSGGAAALVGIGGTALIIFLLVITIRAIYGNKRRKRKELIRKEEMKEQGN
ncbi:MAG: hypothetical protein ACSLE0_22920 [Chitinophagaceae bacterium]